MNVIEFLNFLRDLVNLSKTGQKNFFAINSHFSNPFQPKSSIFALRADHHPRFIKLRRIAVNL